MSGENKKRYISSKEIPTLVEVPASKFCIKGMGNPNNEDFANRVGVLYQVSYTVRMMPKRDSHQKDILNIQYIH